MKRLGSTAKAKKQNTILLGAMAGLAALVSLAPAGQVQAAACTAPSTDYGKATLTLSAPAAATYRLWSRVWVPDSSNKTYLLEIDGAHCFNVGGGSIPASTWAWVDYHSGSTSSKVQLSLNQGNHAIKLIGNKPGVKVDRIVALSDQNCVPTGNGNNCDVPADAAPPTVTLTTPLDGANVSGSIAVSATATDNTGVSKVVFYDNSSVIATDTSSPYSATWDSSKTPNGSHLITARAYDAAGNISSDSSTVTAKNGDSQAPSVPGNVKASASAYNKVQISWSASSDNVGVTGYTVIRDGVPLTNVGKVTSYTNASLSPSKTYSYQVLAFDAAGNKSAASGKVSATTPSVPDSEAPSKPSGLTGEAGGPTQINLSWRASTDNIGVAAYDVYRSSGGAKAQKIGSSPSASFGDSNLAANTKYTYYVIALDAAGNASQPSKTASATTPKPPADVSSVRGTITGQAPGAVLPYARAVIVIDGYRHIYQADKHGRYAMFNVKIGRHNVSFHANGHNSQTVSVDLTTTPLVRDISLQKKK